jgi:nitrogen fixation/metabolism regulation signal transduction histidine kinase
MKLFILIFILFLIILYWNYQLKRKVEKEIAARLENEHLLFRQHRLIAMGEMMSNIAHQWRQPINTINLLALNIQKKYYKKQLSKAYIDEKVSNIERNIEYMSQTIDDFSTYLSPNKKKANFSLNNSIRVAMKLTEPMHKKKSYQYTFLYKKRI